MSEKKKISGITIIIVLAMLLFASYFVGLHDGRNQGKEQLCEDMGGWLGLNKESNDIELAFTTEIITFPTGQRHLIIYLTGSKDHTIQSWIDDWSEPLEKFCKEHKVNYIETHGRDGWLKVLKPLGYEKYYTVQIKEVRYD